MSWNLPKYPDNWKELRELTLKRDGYRCRTCGESDRRLLEVAHIVSMSRGGSSDISNLITKCSRCHAQDYKHNHHRFNKNPKGKVLL